MLTATNIVDQTASIDRIPPAMWTTFTLGERASLKEYAKQKVKGDPIATNWTSTTISFSSRRRTKRRAVPLEESDAVSLAARRHGIQAGRRAASGPPPRRRPGGIKSSPASGRRSRSSRARSKRLASIPTRKPGRTTPSASTLRTRGRSGGPALRGPAQAEAQREGAAGHRRQPARAGNDRRHRMVRDQLLGRRRSASSSARQAKATSFWTRRMCPAGERAKIEDTLKRNKQPVTPPTCSGSISRSCRRWCRLPLNEYDALATEQRRRSVPGERV
jgi:hypothetical protein